MEDIDWAYRARAAGWHAWYEPAARVIHHHLARSDRALLSRATPGCTCRACGGTSASTWRRRRCGCAWRTKRCPDTTTAQVSVPDGGAPGADVDTKGGRTLSCVVRLLFTLTAYPPAIGGAQLLMHRVAVQLSARHAVRVVTQWDSASDRLAPGHDRPRSLAPQGLRDRRREGGTHRAARRREGQPGALGPLPTTSRRALPCGASRAPCKRRSPLGGRCRHRAQLPYRTRGSHRRLAGAGAPPRHTVRAHACPSSAMAGFLIGTTTASIARPTP